MKEKIQLENITVIFFFLLKIKKDLFYLIALLNFY